MADLNQPREQLPNTIFIRTDISSWAQQSSLFSRAHAWHSRLDFVALNAGTDDRDDMFNTISRDPDAPPAKPNMLTFDTNLYGTYYGIKLSVHYLSLTSKNKSTPGGKIIVTASSAGLYPLEICPQYAASKHALVGLVRSLALQSRPHSITVNAVCPALVSTNLPPPGLMEHFSDEEITPMSTILRCFAELGHLDNCEGDDGSLQKWLEGGPNGETVEGSLDQLIYHKPPEHGSGSYVNERGIQAWRNAYTEKNIRYAKESQARGSQIQR